MPPPPAAKPDPNMPDKPQPSSKPLPDPSKESSSASEDTTDPDDVDKPADSNAPADKNSDSAKPAKSGKNSKNANAAAKPDPNAPVYDPYHAAKDVDIGLYYQHKGDLPAAIDRFKEAIHLKPDYAKPRLLLAEIYDHEHEYDSALRYYREYLKVLPTASDAKRIQERIDKLSSQSKKPS